MTKSLEDYIEVVYVLIHEKNRARVRDIATSLKVKMPSVVKGISELKKLGLVTQEPYGDVELTAKGRRIATMILNRHNKIREFLMLLGVSKRIADKDACQMEHIISAETLDRIRDFLRKAKKGSAEKASGNTEDMKK
ncbi:MAG: metal-dependent transcriptional regulator [Lentisphaerae bacterium]|nr:metal-dependent transcriptional regulator [Lentisphaerota bacterium]